MNTLAIVAVILLAATSVLCDKEREEHGHSHAHGHGHGHGHESEDEHDPHVDHEAVLGSKEEEKEFDNLPPEEAKKRLRVIAVKMDTDADGKVSRDEMYNWVLKSFLRLDNTDAGTRLDEYDADKDKLISWDELLKNVYSYTEDEIKDIEKDSENSDVLDMIAVDRRKFTTADLNKDGKLTVEEFASFENPHNYMHMRNFEIERMMKDHDKDKDNKITFKEFRAAEAGGQEDELDPSNEVYDKEQFDNLDKDKDGILDQNEVVGWVSPSNEDTAKEEMEHLFSNADKDNDQYLSPEEIVNEHQLFVGSQATDYGQDLRDEL